MQTKDWWYLIAVILSPFLTTFLTLVWQRRKEKRDAKLKVFSSLMAVRGNITDFQAAQEWIHALLQIDVVFSDAPDVLQEWNDYYLMIQQPNPPPGQGHKMIDLYSAMAKTLGYHELKQTDIDRGHFPRAISEPIDKGSQLQESWLRVLKNTEAVIVQPRSQAQSKIDQ